MSELISRELLLKVIHEEDIYTPDEMWKPAKEWVEIIKAMPTVESRPKGKWVRTIRHDIFKCSNCRDYIMTQEIKYHKFCYRCGADMRGE